MSTILFRIYCVLFGLSAVVLDVSGQAYYCKRPALAVLRKIPTLKYSCRDNVADYDEKLLTFPERVKAIREYANSLERVDDPAWWASSVDDLSFCDVHQKVGPLTKQERGRLNGGDYFYRLFRDHQIRIIMTDDPWFQTGYGGSNPLSSLPDEPSCGRYRNRGWVFFESR